MMEKKAAKVSESKKVYFVRHGESLGNRDGFIMGQDDVELTDKGREQAREAGEKLADMNIDLIVSSSLLRASETAEIIADVIGYDRAVIKDGRLQERNMGAWQGGSSGAFHEKLEEVGEKEFQKMGDIESLEALRDRALSFIDWLKTRNEQNTLIVGHHAYSMMLRTVIEDAGKYKNAFTKHHDKIGTGKFIKLNIPDFMQ